LQTPTPGATSNHGGQHLCKVARGPDRTTLPAVGNRHLSEPDARERRTVYGPALVAATPPADAEHTATIHRRIDLVERIVEHDPRFSITARERQWFLQHAVGEQQAGAVDLTPCGQGI